MASLLRKIFKRKAPPPLACSVSLGEDGHPVGEDPNHQHTAACFTAFEPLAILELFQSQSCVSCPPAIPSIHTASDDPNVLLLSYNVTLFDSAGWKDTFANTNSDNRHRAYARKWGRNSIFTPQIVANGAADGNGRTTDDARAVVRQGRDAVRTQGRNIYIDANDNEVRVDTDTVEAQPHEVLLVLFDSKDQNIKVGKGPNKGKKLNHRNVVTDVIKVGDWTGGNAVWALPVSRRSLNQDSGAVVLLQEGGPGGLIAAAARI